MAPRKETPDVLSAVLNDDSIKADPLPQAETILKKARAGEKRSYTRRKTRSGRQIDAKRRTRKWEYQTITFHDYGGWRARYIDNVQIQGWKQQPEMLQHLNELGEQGWEMSGSSRDGRSAIIVFFKRPKA